MSVISLMKARTKVLLPLMALFCNDSQAFDWLFEPDFNITERYTDNVRLQVNPKHDTLLTTISPGILVGYIAENQELKASFNWNELIYHTDSELDFSEKIGNIKHLFVGERFRADFSAKYAVQSSLNRQLDVEGSGNIQQLVPRTTRSLSPSFTYNLNEKNALQLSYSYTDVSFDRTPGLKSNLGFSDYDNQQFSAAFIHTFSERLSVNLSVAYSRFNSASDTSVVTPNIFGLPIERTVISNFSQSSSTLFYQAGAQYAFDENTQISFSAGIRDSQTSSDFIQSVIYDPEVGPFQNVLPQTFRQSSSAFGHVFSVNLKHTRDWGGFDLSAGQQLNPSSSGRQQQSTRFAVNGHYKLDDRWTTGLDASYLKTESISNFAGGSNQFNRTYSTVSPNVRWRWTRTMSWELSYSYRQQEYDSRNVTATSNGIQLQFTFQPEINRKVK